jgi:hypothetical protein
VREWERRFCNPRYDNGKFNTSRKKFIFNTCLRLLLLPLYMWHVWRIKILHEKHKYVCASRCVDRRGERNFFSHILCRKILTSSLTLWWCV